MADAQILASEFCRQAYRLSTAWRLEIGKRPRAFAVTFVKGVNAAEPDFRYSGLGRLLRSFARHRAVEENS